jgi:hypothetical protein
VKKKIWSKLQRIKEHLTQKIVIKLSKYRFRIRDPEKPVPDPGSKRHTPIGNCVDLK